MTNEMKRKSLPRFANLVEWADDDNRPDEFVCGRKVWYTVTNEDFDVLVLSGRGGLDCFRLKDLQHGEKLRAAVLRTAAMRAGA